MHLTRNRDLDGGFTRPETLGVFLILLVIVALSVFNFQLSQTKARDAQRKNDLAHLHGALKNFFDDLNFYPDSLDGKLVACGQAEDLKPCQWGKDQLRNLEDPDYPAYMSPLPADPRAKEGYSYFYLTNTREFQLYAYLEYQGDVEIKPGIEARGLPCGIKICNYGKASSDRIPLDEELPAAPATQEGEIRQQ